MGNHHRRFYIMGPGGMRCACCYPAPGKGRVKLERTFKRREKMNAKKTMHAEMLDA